MKKLLSLVALAAVLFAGPAYAADPIIGSWKLNVAKSKFIPGAELTAGTRVYTEAEGLYTMDRKVTSSRSQYREGKETKQPAGSPYDTSAAKKVDANTWDFALKKGGKTVNQVHRVVSADGKTLTSHSANAQRGGMSGEETLVFDKQ